MILFDEVSKIYRGAAQPALSGVSLDIQPGEFVFIVGSSGSGKSSLLRLVLKEERPSAGSVHVLGQDLRRIPARKVPLFRRSLGVVFQDFRLLPQKTVFDNVAFTLQVIGKSQGFIHEAVPDVLQTVGLAAKAENYPHELSGGEQQRVAIARAAVNKPAILLADEPTGNLDPATSAGIMNVLSRINASGTTVLMATHDAGIVNEMQRRVVEISKGRIVRDEHQGGYQTSSVPLGEADTAPIPVQSDEGAVATPIRTNVDLSVDPDEVPSSFPWELRA
jgi:cell division transport system ATP-binding protein